MRKERRKNANVAIRLIIQNNFLILKIQLVNNSDSGMIIFDMIIQMMSINYLINSSSIEICFIFALLKNSFR